MRFNRGDRVRILREFQYLKEGTEGVVEKIGTEEKYFIRFESGPRLLFKEDELELVEKKEVNAPVRIMNQETQRILYMLENMSEKLEEMLRLSEGGFRPNEAKQGLLYLKDCVNVVGKHLKRRH